MALNYPGPYQLRLYYTVEGDVHVAKYNVDCSGSPSIGDSFSDIDLIQNDLSTIAADTYVAVWVLKMVDRFSDTNTSIDYAELWKFEPFSFDGTYLSTLSIGDTGAIGNPAILARQETYTFRTAEGGIMRVAMLEGAGVFINRQAYGTLAGSTKDLMDFVVGSSGAFLGADTSRVVAPVAVSGSYNRALFRKRYR